MRDGAATLLLLAAALSVGESYLDNTNNSVPHLLLRYVFLRMDPKFMLHINFTICVGSSKAPVELCRWIWFDYPRFTDLTSSKL